MKAWIKFCCSIGIPMVIIAVFAEVIFFSKYILRYFNSLTSTASSPKRLARTIAPNAVKTDELMVCGTPRGSRSRPTKNKHEAYVQIQYW